MKTKKIVYAGVLVACGVLLPQIFHMIGGPGLGGILLPMHIPVLIAGFMLSPLLGLIVGVLTPLCSFLYTGGSMPGIPMLYFMILELGAYGFATSLLWRRFKLGVFGSLIGGMVVGRLVRGTAFIVATQLLGVALPPVFGVMAAIAQGMPGIIVQLVVIPPIMIMMKKKGWLEDDKGRTQRLSQ